MRQRIVEILDCDRYVFDLSEHEAHPSAEQILYGRLPAEEAWS
jgi:hypothetical protein